MAFGTGHGILAEILPASWKVENSPNSQVKLDIFAELLVPVQYVVLRTMAYSSACIDVFDFFSAKALILSD